MLNICSVLPVSIRAYGQAGTVCVWAPARSKWPLLDFPQLLIGNATSTSMAITQSQINCLVQIDRYMIRWKPMLTNTLDSQFLRLISVDKFWYFDICIVWTGFDLVPMHVREGAKSIFVRNICSSNSQVPHVPIYLLLLLGVWDPHVTKNTFMSEFIVNEKLNLVLMFSNRIAMDWQMKRTIVKSL